MKKVKIMLIFSVLLLLFNPISVNSQSQIKDYPISFDTDNELINHLFILLQQMSDKITYDPSSENELVEYPISNGLFDDENFLDFSINDSWNVGDIKTYGNLYQNTTLSTIYPLAWTGDLYHGNNKLYIDTLYLNSSLDLSFFEPITSINDDQFNGIYPGTIDFPIFNDIYKWFMGSLFHIFNGYVYSYHGISINHFLNSTSSLHNYNISINTSFHYNDGSNISSYDYELTNLLLNRDCLDTYNLFNSNIKSVKAINDSLLSIVSNGSILDDINWLNSLFPSHQSFNTTYIIENNNLEIQFGPNQICDFDFYDIYQSPTFLSLTSNTHSAGLYNPFRSSNLLTLAPTRSHHNSHVVFSIYNQTAPSLLYSLPEHYFAFNNYELRLSLPSVSSVNTSKKVSSHTPRAGFFITSNEPIPEFIFSDIYHSYFDTNYLFPLLSLYPPNSILYAPINSSYSTPSFHTSIISVTHTNYQTLYTVSKLTFPLFGLSILIIPILYLRRFFITNT